eukprot:5676270-Alexandrium_andersonii.AAC.1
MCIRDSSRRGPWPCGTKGRRARDLGAGAGGRPPGGPPETAGAGRAGSPEMRAGEPQAQVPGRGRGLG